MSDSTFPGRTTAGAPLEVGASAPRFELPDQYRHPTRLSDLLAGSGAGAVVVFFPAAFTPTCAGELTTFAREEDELRRRGVELVAVSCDPPAALRAFGEQHGVDYPLLSDFWPHGDVSRAYGVFVTETGTAARGTVAVDREGVVRRVQVEPPGGARSAPDVRAALAALVG